MSVVQSSKCLFCSFARNATRTSTSQRQFNSSAVQWARRAKPAQTVVGAPNLQELKPLTQEQLDRYYSPEQQASIKAAQKLIPQQQIDNTRIRVDPWSVNYYDDFSQIDPVVDKPVKAPWTNIDGQSRLKTDDETAEDLRQLMENLPDDDAQAEQAWLDFDRNMRLTVGREEAERNPRSALAPEIPKQTDDVKTTTKSKRPDGQEQQAPSPALVRLMQMTGYSAQEISRLRVKAVNIHTVVNQTRLGKIQKFYVLSIAGNGNGLIGVGEGKSEELSEASIQSQYQAIRNMRPILRYENRTIFGDVSGKVSATELQLYARPPGFGLRCQQYIWEICKCAGIHDLAARVTRSRNPMNTVKAAVEALHSQKNPEDIARARGKKLVDVRKVYYAGQ